MIYLNDLYQYVEMRNMWKKMKHNGPVPKARRGHLMFCYYNYLIIFGGEGEGGVVLGDLWIYDVVKRTWHQIMDASNIHQLTHQNVTGIIPAP